MNKWITFFVNLQFENRWPFLLSWSTQILLLMLNHLKVRESHFTVSVNMPYYGWPCVCAGWIYLLCIQYYPHLLVSAGSAYGLVLSAKTFILHHKHNPCLHIKCVTASDSTFWPGQKCLHKVLSSGDTPPSSRQTQSTLTCMLIETLFIQYPSTILMAWNDNK